ncbi:arabinan endo-1,5-alpha-L-arabinosidase [Alteriqipengyuania lutimaris]|uniref:arabinan endo-1,5-alpha-L-arabinosidase n=1 Tax=Alteriqipengyuania lutimaris TaxID=1538146 RepID=UPI0015F1B51E|nr:arabinan endo-1,5-alpha-L-arabinosidase [Alteriqipengyuania lutimaris]MBB3035035.1 arabinan endo-1,5-alpha-L-arabinosidase [Alteriqipengyuania lutimaris]
MADAGSPEPLATIHDPVLMAEDGSYYLYSTGSPDHSPLRAHRSPDLVNWTALPAPFPLPEWTTQAVPGARGAWAPDISRYDGGYRLYYSVSTFGSQVSAMGLATSPTLDPDASDYAWTDHGPVVTSTQGDPYNAIDPNFVTDRDGRAWLSFGSFWGGLMLVELDPATGLRKPGAPVTNIARRPDNAENAIEAPFIFERDGWYYLLASFDRCCNGVESTYKTVIGRSRAIDGPYVDRSGRSMLDGGGTIIAAAEPDDRFRGPGHPGHFRDSEGRDILVFHAYDAENDGRPTLRIGELTWTSGWPELEMLELPQ